jgi:hypothetical protein
VREKKGRFFVQLLLSCWRIVCGPIFIKFYYVVLDDEGYILTSVDCWFFSPVAFAHIHLVRYLFIAIVEIHFYSDEFIFNSRIHVFLMNW